jgi:hypothetical protein
MYKFTSHGCHQDVIKTHIISYDDTAVLPTSIVLLPMEKYEPWITEKKVLKFGWEDNIKMDLEEIGCECMHWIHLVKDKDQIVGSCKHGNAFYRENFETRSSS